MRKIGPPQQSLEEYFNELLHEQNESLPAAAPTESLSHVKPKLEREPTLKPQASAQTAPVAPEHIAKVAKLLQTVPLPTAEPKLDAPVKKVAAPLTNVPEADAHYKQEEPPVEKELGNEVGALFEANVEAINSGDTELDTKLQWLENGRPAWAQESFEALLFKVSGLTLAVPLAALGHIQPINNELKPLFGQADWFMGLLLTPVGQINTVNTAKFVMPERYDEHFVETAKYVVSINGLPWGLAVDSVNQPVKLAPEDVNWSGNSCQRPWLAGTVKAHMCALIDIARMGRLLMAADTHSSG